MNRLRYFSFLNCIPPSWVALCNINRKRIIANALFLGGALLLGQGLYMDAKAIIAQSLIAHSWQQRTATSPPPKPWWWADTKAIAELRVSRLEKKVFVMQDDSGESLAFGPGHLTASAGISESGHVMIAGHRDSHFNFLQQLRIGDVLETTHSSSKTRRYQIQELVIINSKKDELIRYDDNRLTLITCYPFDSVVPGSPLRYIVNASAIET